jgi:hypothetical protein
VGKVDFALFMERYGYEILLRLMIGFTVGFITGVLIFWSYLTSGAAFLIVVYTGIMAVLKRLYEFLLGENPDAPSEGNEVNKVRERSSMLFMGRF